MKIAYFYKKHRVLRYFCQKNVTENKHCETLERAKRILKNCNIEQKLEVIK